MGMLLEKERVDFMQAEQDTHLPESFIFPRLIGFGECDAARIYKTPRAVDCAVEALDAWFEAVLGVSWADLLRLHDLDLSFTRIASEYLRPITAGQLVTIRVNVVGIDQTAITFRATGEIDAGQPCFRVTLVACFAERTSPAAIPVPARFRDRIEQYRATHAAEVLTPRSELHTPRSAATQGQTGTGQLPLQLDRGGAAFVRQHRVVYGECGMSGRVYAPRVYDYALEAVGEWYHRTLGISWLQQCILLKGQPFVDINCSYLGDMEPGCMLDIVVQVSRLGAASIVYSVTGYDDRGLPCFDVRMAACYIDESSGVYKPTPFPEEYRRRILAYQATCQAAG
jgi:acyl-CoA thioesterase FadM